MTPERLKEIVMMDSSATPGPWSRVDNENQHWGLRRVHGPAVRVGGFTIATDLTIEEGWQIESDCNFIAASRTAVPELLAHVASLTTRLAAETEARERAEAECEKNDTEIAGWMRATQTAERELTTAREQLAASKWCTVHAVSQPCQFCPDARIVAQLAEEMTRRSALQQELATVRERLAMATRFYIGEKILSRIGKRWVVHTRSTGGGWHFGETEPSFDSFDEAFASASKP